LTDDSADVEIEMDIAEFSSMFLGVITFKKLYEFNLANISDISYLDTVNRVFQREEKPACMTSF